MGVCLFFMGVGLLFMGVGLLFMGVGLLFGFVVTTRRGATNFFFRCDDDRR
jgi:hypothetical protein